MFGGRAVLEVPLKDSTAYVNLQHVGGNRFVLEGRTDYDELSCHLTSWRESDHYVSDDQYKAFVERSVVSGGVMYNSDKAHPNALQNSGLGRGTGWNPYYQGYSGMGSQMGGQMGMSSMGSGMYNSGLGMNRSALPRDPTQTDESIVFATRDTKNALNKSQLDLERTTAERQHLMDQEQFERKTRYEGLAHSKPWMELEPKFFEEPRFLFTSDSNGNVKQFSLRDCSVINDFGKKYTNQTIYVICSTRNSKYLFVSDQCGNVKQVSVADSTIVKDYGKVFKAPITSLKCSPDSKFLLVGDENGHLKQFDVETQK